MNDIEIIAVPALNDNYIWTIIQRSSGLAACVDPGDATPLLRFLRAEKLQLCAILVTHHHWDHTQGIPELLAHYNVPVFGSARSPNPSITQCLQDGDDMLIEAINMPFTIMSIPGHTLDHIAYVASGLVFCGDTLFAAGCGRIFEGDAPMMYRSLQRLATLPAQTLVYCAHEYTLANLAFASLVEPENPAIKTRQAQCTQLRRENLPTLPVTLTEELATNPFLRCEVLSVQSTVQQKLSEPSKNPVEIFAALRNWKNRL